MAPEKSLEAVVWCAVGGRNSLIGPILGAIGVNALKSYATHAFAEQWPYLLGALFVFVTLFMPQGIVGIPAQLARLRRKPAPPTSPTASPAPSTATATATASHPAP
jgi:ABC-type branched-subunit amino acid transport system permease subunit